MGVQIARARARSSNALMYCRRPSNLKNMRKDPVSVQLLHRRTESAGAACGLGASRRRAASGCSSSRTALRLSLLCGLALSAIACSRAMPTPRKLAHCRSFAVSCFDSLKILDACFPHVSSGLSLDSGAIFLRATLSGTRAFLKLSHLARRQATHTQAIRPKRPFAFPFQKLLDQRLKPEAFAHTIRAR